MDIIKYAVERLQSATHDSGLEDGDIVLRVNPGEVLCQYERGACMEAHFAESVAEFVTMDPTRVKTRLSFLFGGEFGTPRQRAAAGAIINAVAGFLLISRIRRSCLPESHSDCLIDLSQRIGSAAMYPLGKIPKIQENFGQHVVADPETADLILVNGDAMISPEGDALLDRFVGKKRILFLGPSTAGTCSLLKYEHHCPYGRR